MISKDKQIADLKAALVNLKEYIQTTECVLMPEFATIYNVLWLKVNAALLLQMTVEWVNQSKDGTQDTSPDVRRDAEESDSIDRKLAQDGKPRFVATRYTNTKTQEPYWSITDGDVEFLCFEQERSSITKELAMWGFKDGSYHLEIIEE